MADSSTFTAVDLSRLPAPAIIETLDYETILARKIALIRTGVAGVFYGIPDFDATVESDPAVKLLEISAYDEMLFRQRVNDAARAVMLPYAMGADLDNLGSLYPVQRFLITPADPVTGATAVYESDDALRRRILLAPEGFSVAGPEGAYIFHALSADPQVLDASAIEPSHAQGNPLPDGDDGKPAPGSVLVSVLSRSADGSATADLVATVAAYLTADTRRPLTDNLIVRSATIVDFAIEAVLTVFTGPDSAIVLAQAQSQLQTYLAESLRLGRDITRFGIMAAIAVAGIQNVDLVSPAADIVLDRTQAGHCTGITMTVAGIGE